MEVQTKRAESWSKNVLVFSHTVSLTCRKQGTQLGLNHWDLGDVREVENVVTAY